MGNIWRFPYTTGENGGGAFLILYLICIVLLGLPIMIAELAIGRYSRRNPVGAFAAIQPGTPWKLIGYMGVITGIFILSYYSVLAGYTVGYIGKSLAGNSSTYEAFTSNPLISIPLFRRRGDPLRPIPADPCFVIPALRVRPSGEAAVLPGRILRGRDAEIG